MNRQSAKYVYDAKQEVRLRHKARSTFRTLSTLYDTIMPDTCQCTFVKTTECMDSPGDSVGKESACNARDTGDMGLVPGSGRSPGERNGNSLQCSCLRNPMDRGTWQGYST